MANLAILTTKAQRRGLDYYIRGWVRAINEVNNPNGNFAAKYNYNKNLPPGNTATGLTQFDLKKGALFFEGVAGKNFGKLGGDTQIFIPDLDDLLQNIK